MGILTKGILQVDQKYPSVRKNLFSRSTRSSTRWGRMSDSARRAEKVTKASAVGRQSHYSPHLDSDLFSWDGDPQWQEEWGTRNIHQVLQQEKDQKNQPSPWTPKGLFPFTRWAAHYWRSDCCQAPEGLWRHHGHQALYDLLGTWMKT